MNVPYTRKNGIKITKTTPYINQYPNRKTRRGLGSRLFNNKKGVQLVVTYFGSGKFSRVHKDFQRLEDRTLVQYKLIR